MGCHSLLQGIFPTQGSNLHLLHYRQILYHPSHREALRPETEYAHKSLKDLVEMQTLISWYPSDAHAAGSDHTWSGGPYRVSRLRSRILA